MSTPISPRSVKEKPIAYERFTGLETLRDPTAQDIGSKQPLLRVSNGFIDFVGQVVKDAGVDRVSNAFNVVEVAHLNLFELTWIERRDGGYIFKTSTGRESPAGWDIQRTPTISSFGSKLVYLAQGQVPWTYDGSIFAPVSGDKPLNSRLRPSFGVSVQSRFVVGGMPQYPGVIEISRVNDLDYFSDEEAVDEESVNRGGKIDIWSVVGRRETLTGLAAFETNKLVIFTGSRGIIYQLTTDIDGWQIEDKTSITNGCLSHRTIASANQDILYCSRNGVYSVSRSRQNGIVVSSACLSDSIALLYRKLVRTVEDPRRISAVWDQDESQYHVFFPQTNARSIRLTMTLDSGGAQPVARWSVSEEGLMPTCGDFFEGSLVYGSDEALYQVGKTEEEQHEKNPQLIIETPILYLGSFLDAKQINSLIISASGKAELFIEMLHGKTNKVFWSKRVEVEEQAVPGSFYGVPIEESRRIPVNQRTTSMRLRITANGAGLFRLAGFAFVIGS
jgi:hypothetical protein